MESKLTPSLRFREYEHEWKAKTFKELGSVAMCKRIFKEQTTAQGEIPFYKIGTFGKVADSYISRETYEEYKGKYIYPKVGDILLSASGTIGRTVIYDGEDAYFQDSNIIWFNAHKESLDNSFLYQFYQVVKWNGLEGSTIKRLYNENVLSTNINLPSLDEQTKIGSFFKNLDDTISLHQQELEAFQQIKQGFLQKLFPREAEVVPEIRFIDFKEDWETKKISKIATETFGGGTPKTAEKRFWSGDIPWIQSSDITQHKVYEVFPKKTISEEAVKSSATKLIPKDSIAVVTRVGVGKVALIEYDYSTSQDFVSLSNLKSDKWFTIYALYKILQRELHNVQGTSIKGITKSELLEKNIMLPPNIEEQVKIGEFFRQLDEVIELKEKEVEALKETKKGFLQKMFV